MHCTSQLSLTNPQSTGGGGEKHRAHHGLQPHIYMNLTERGSLLGEWQYLGSLLFSSLLRAPPLDFQLNPWHTFAFRNFLVWRWTLALSVSRFSTGVKLSFSLCPCRSIHKMSNMSVTLSSTSLAHGGDHQH